LVLSITITIIIRHLVCLSCHPFFSIVFPLSYRHDRQSNRTKQKKIQTSVFTSEETRRREIYHSTPSPISLIVVLFNWIAKESVCSTNCFWSCRHATALLTVKRNMHDTFIDLIIYILTMEIRRKEWWHQHVCRLLGRGREREWSISIIFCVLSLSMLFLKHEINICQNSFNMILHPE